MSTPRDNDVLARAVFAGLAPSSRVDGDRPVRQDTGRLPRGVLATGGLVLAGAMTVTMNLTGPLEGTASAKPTMTPPLESGSLPVLPAAVATSPAPASYTVKAGDTVSAISARYGLATASVLALNGLSWKSLIFPGQVLKLTRSGTAPRPTTPPPAAPTPVAAPAASSYTVKSGDTISAIASRHGVSTQRVLDANGLRISSIIYPGQRIVIPGREGSITPLTAEQAGNARIIINVGRTLGVSERGIVIALATAMQESSLRNIPYGDRDSVGLFQQRPSAGWGTVERLLDPEHSARLFYGGPSNPNKGVTRGLLEISGWQSMTLTQAAQAVQISAYPDAYKKWETSAWAWFAQLG